jgi:hypothetical protein
MLKHNLMQTLCVDTIALTIGGILITDRCYLWLTAAGSRCSLTVRAAPSRRQMVTYFCGSQCLPQQSTGFLTRGRLLNGSHVA